MLHSKKNQLSVRLLAIAAIMLSPAAANAATAGDISAAQVLNTSPVYADSASFHTCNVANVSTATISVAVELINSNGGVLISLIRANVATFHSPDSGTTFQTYAFSEAR
jgi:hypothetical protein